MEVQDTREGTRPCAFPVAVEPKVAMHSSHAFWQEGGGVIVGTRDGS